MCYASIGWSMLIYYTQLSNLFLLIAATVCVAASARALRDKKRKISDKVFRLFHAATSVTTVTFLVVIFVLSWMYGDLVYILTGGSMLFTHTLCPILGIIIHFYFAPKNFTKRAAKQALIFTLAYAIIAIAMNLLHLWHGPYPFLYVYEQPIWASIMWMVVLLAAAYEIARMLLIGKIKK